MFVFFKYSKFLLIIAISSSKNDNSLTHVCDFCIMNFIVYLNMFYVKANS